MVTVKIVVEGGMVTSVYSDHDVIVEVIDFDTQDPEEQEAAEAAFKEVKTEIKNNKTHIVW